MRYLKTITVLIIFSCLLAPLCAFSEIKTTSSSVQENFGPQNAVDGNMATRWSSEFSDPQWLLLDFGEIREITGLLLYWQEAYAVSYEIAVSIDNKNWKVVYNQTLGKGGCEEISFGQIRVRYIKIIFRKRATEWGYSLFEVCPEGVGFSDLNKINSGEIISLEGEWFFKTDPKNTGVKDKWFSSNYSVDDWQKIETGKFWDEQGYADYDGYAWYKNDIFIPANWAGCEPGIMFGGVDDAYELFINGRRVGAFGSMSCESTSMCRTITACLLGDYLNPGEINNFTIRVFDFWGAGGINERPMILFQNGSCLKLLKKRADAQSYYQRKAKPSRKKYYPQWTGGRQAYWTIVGTNGGEAEATICEDGMIQIYNRGPSLMPFIYLENKLLASPDFAITQSLKDGYLPIPRVNWENEELTFSQEIFAARRNGNSYACLRYILKNKSNRELKGKLFFTIRPFQVNPPWQWAGGMAEIKSLNLRGLNNIISINGQDRIIALKAPDKFDTSAYIEGDIVDKIKTGEINSQKLVEDAFGYASGALEYDFVLDERRAQEYLFIISLKNNKVTTSDLLKANSSFVKLCKKADLCEDFAAMEKETTSYWRKKLNKVSIQIPNEKMLKTIRSSLAYILINRDGPMLQAGSGAYEKSWMRDACVSSAALLRMGYKEEVREYIDWISDYVKANGKVPPIMIAENTPDPAWESVYEEYDSQGQYIFSVLQYYYFTKDEEWLRGKLPVVARVLDCMEKLRKKNLTDKYQTADKKRFYGIFPLSVSHEGYFPPPGVHSYWDDFWGLRGWSDARKIAEILGEDELAERAKKEIKSFRKCLYDSIRLVQELDKINYIPGCAERGDFDAPSTAIAVWPTEESKYLPQASLLNTFGIFWADRFSPTLKNKSNWSYPSYALRISQVFVLFNQRDKAIRMLEQYLDLQRPRAWNQWAEGTLSDDRKPWFIGDLPHSWVASIYINSFRSLFVYEKDGCLVLGHGIPEKWITEKAEVSIGDFPTYYGNISYSIKEKGGSLQIHVAGNATPPKGFLLKLRLNLAGAYEVILNGKQYTDFLNEGIYFDSLPVEIRVNINNKGVNKCDI